MKLLDPTWPRPSACPFIDMRACMRKTARFPIKAEKLAHLINNELRQYEACRGHELLTVERRAAPGTDGCNWMPGPLSGVSNESSYGLFVFARIIRDFRLRYNVA